MFRRGNSCSRSSCFRVPILSERTSCSLHRYGASTTMTTLSPPCMLSRAPASFGRKGRADHRADDQRISVVVAMSRRMYSSTVDRKEADRWASEGVKWIEGIEGVGKDEGKGLALLVKAAAHGSALAKFHMGRLYRDGRAGLKQDLSKAKELFAIVAGEGMPEAFYCLGFLHDNEGDEENAIGCYEAAAQHGLPEAMNNLGNIYAKKEELGKARMWWQKAAGMGHGESQANLAVLYATGDDGLAKDERKAIELFKKAAEKGVPNALDWMGGAYARGVGGIAKDIDSAIDMYRRAADKGWIPAQYHLGEMYDKVLEQYGEAAKWYTLAAQHDYPEAQHQLAALYMTGRGVERDERKAIEYNEKAAAQGYPLAWAGLGAIYSVGMAKDERKALSCFEKVLDLVGGLKPDYHLAWVYHNMGHLLFRAEDATVRDRQRASELFRFAMSLGFHQASYDLFVCEKEMEKETSSQQHKGSKEEEEEGKTTKKTDTRRESFDSLLKRAQEGDVEAQLGVGAIYQSGAGGVKVDVHKATEWLERAAVGGSLKAKVLLVLVHIEGGMGDPGKMLSWCREIIESGDPVGSYALGRMHMVGQYGVPKDYQKAVELFEEAASKGSADGLNGLGCMYSDGTGVAVDKEKAFRLFQRAADKGHVDGIFNLAMMHWNGWGTHRDPQKGLSLFRQAAGLGHVRAAMLHRQLSNL